MTERLWTPWRMDYVGGKQEPGCVLCTKPAQATDRDNLVLYRGKLAYVLMNLYPYNPGHLMIAPYEHTASLASLSHEARAEVFDLASICTEALQQVMTPAGFNLGVNLGRPAGAGIADHLHMHVVPRWEGDTNFMPILAETRVLPETLPATYDKLLPVIRALAG